MAQCILIITVDHKPAIVINVHSVMSAFKCLQKISLDYHELSHLFFHSECTSKLFKLAAIFLKYILTLDPPFLI